MSNNNLFSFDLNEASEPQEDDAYDALNSETFGDVDVNDDWEENHQNLVSEFKGDDYDLLNDSISLRVASSILDEDGARGGGEEPNEHGFQSTEKLKKIVTVQELEAQLQRNVFFKETTQQSSCNDEMMEERPRNRPFNHTRQQHGPPTRGRHGPPPRGRHGPPPLGRHGPPPNATRFMAPPMPMPNQRTSTMQFMHPAQRGMNMHYHTIPNHSNTDYRFRPPHQFPAPGPQYHAGAPQIPNYQEFLRQPPPHPHMFNLPAHGPPFDEYAGLMRPQEKQWLANIQMMQLNTNQPFLDDYYYNMYHQRHQGHVARKNNNKSFQNTRVVTYSRQPTRYIPLQFENSLGKLQVGSVTAPRKIIDMVVPCNNIETTVKHVDRKSKEILFEIEQLFDIVLKMEETSHNNITNSELPGEEEPNLQALQDKILKTLLKRDKLVSIMSIRKGKKVVLRLLPILDHPAPLVHQLLVDLVPIARKDVEQLLLSFLPPIRTYFSSVDLATIVQIVKPYDSEFLLSTKFTTSVIATMIDRAAQVLHQCDDTDIIQEWKQTLIRLILSTEQSTSNERAVIAVDKDVLQEQLNLVRGLFEQELADKLIRVISYHPHPHPPDTTSNGHN